jgi:hypothetical protein
MIQKKNNLKSNLIPNQIRFTFNPFPIMYHVRNTRLPTCAPSQSVEAVPAASGEASAYDSDPQADVASAISPPSSPENSRYSALSLAHSSPEPPSRASASWISMDSIPVGLPSHSQLGTTSSLNGSSDIRAPPCANSQISLR